MKLLAQIEQVVADPTARAEIHPLLKTLGLWIGLDFENGIKGTKRELRILRGGIMTLGPENPPVPLFGPRNRDEERPIGNDQFTPPVVILQRITALMAGNPAAAQLRGSRVVALTSPRLGKSTATERVFRSQR